MALDLVRLRQQINQRMRPFGQSKMRGLDPSRVNRITETVPVKFCGNCNRRSALYLPQWAEYRCIYCDRQVK